MTRDFAAWAPRCDRDAAASFYIGWSFTFSSLGHSPACRQLSDVDAETRKQAAWTAAIVRDNVVRLRSLKTPPSKITTFAPHKVDVRTYIKGIDYVSRKASNPSNIPGRRGSNNYNLVLLSPDCFKRMCMMSRTKKAEMVRSYFIDVETQFLRYREELLEGLRRDLNPQRAALPPSACKSSGAGYLYIIRATDDGVERMFKVGRTCDVKARLFSYQTGKAHEVDLLYVLKVSDMKSAEKCVRDHVREFQFRTRREVYQVPIDLLKDIMVKCNAIDGVKKEYVRRRQVTRGGGSAPPQFYAAFSRNLVLP